MNLRQWLLGCLNSGLKQAGKMLLAILTTYVTGVHLDWRTMVTVYAVGFTWGIVEWQQANPIPAEDFDLTAGEEIPDIRHLPSHNIPPPSPPPQPQASILTDKIDS
jgi:hypothetical protein